MNFLSNVANRIPLVGHIKGSIHSLVGDHDGANEAMYQSTKSLAIVAAASTGCLLAGPAGCVAAGVSTGVSFDRLASGVTDYKPQGYFDVYSKPIRRL